MRTKNVVKKFAASGAWIGLILLVGCANDNSVGPGPGGDGAANQSVEKISASSVNVFENISSFNQIDRLLHGSDGLSDLDIPELKNPGSALQFAKSRQKMAFAHGQVEAGVLFKIQGSSSDSVIWDVTARNELKGITYRTSLIYDRTTGKGRLFIVGFDYRAAHPLDYDSTEIKVDLNHTILDSTDDMLLSLENLKRFKPGHLIQEQSGRFVPDPYTPGSEPDGGVLTNDISYASSSFISGTQARLEFHAGSGGSYAKDVRFADGSSSSESATFNMNGTGSFAEVKRDGTQISGTFDSADDDGEGGFSLTTSYPSGHDPVSVTESGEFTIDGDDSTLNGSFSREERLLDGTVRNEEVSVSQSVVGDVKTTILDIDNPGEGSGSISIIETPDVDQISGEWTNLDLTFAVFTAQSYPDESAHLEYKLYASHAAFQNGDDPVATGVFDFYPDGSGRGIVTEGDQSYDVTINPDGSVAAEESA